MTYEKKMIKELADKVLLDGLANSEDGSWVVFLDDIKEHLDSTITVDSGILPQLADELKEREEIDEAVANEDCIQMHYVLMLNPDATPVELLSVIGYNPTMPEVLQRYVPSQEESEDESENPEDNDETEEEQEDEESEMLIGQI